MDGPLRQLMPLFLITMWVLFYYLFDWQVIDAVYLYLLLVCAVICLMTFVNFVYVFTFGYALGVIVPNVVLLFKFQPPLIPSLLAVLLILYGLRLLYFQWRRHYAEAYSSIRHSIVDAHKEMPLFVKIILWVFTSWNYLFYSFASYFVLSRYPLDNAAEFPLTLSFGLAMMAVGLGLQALADAQKQAFKSGSASFCNVGLFTTCRHPNYLGEVLFVVGVFVAGLHYYLEWYEYLAAIISPFYLFLLMLDAARRGDIKQANSYAGNAGYQQYQSSTPSLWPRLFRKR